MVPGLSRKALVIRMHEKPVGRKVQRMKMRKMLKKRKASQLWFGRLHHDCREEVEDNDQNHRHTRHSVVVEAEVRAHVHFRDLVHLVALQGGNIR
jgi:hypothetical protein